MKSHILVSVISSALIFAHPSTLIAQVDRDQGNGQTLNNQKSNQETNQTTDPRNYGVVGPISAATQPAETNKGNNIKDQGQDASNAQNTGMIAGLIGAAFSGAMAAITCSKQPPDPSCPAWLLGAAASALMAGLMAGAKKKSNQTVADVTLNPNLPPPEDELQNDPRYKEVENTMAELKRKNPGLDVNLKTGRVKLPDGRVADANNINNRDALKAAGFSDSEIDGFQAATSTALKKGEEEAMKGVDKTPSSSDETILVGGAGGGGIRGKGGYGSSEVGANGKTGDKRDVASIEGLSRNYNGEPIGVAGENIFVLINRRYVVKAGQNILMMQGLASSKGR